MPDSRFFVNRGPFTLGELATIGKCTQQGNPSHGSLRIESVAPIDQATTTDITFLNNPKYASQLKSSKAAACILDEKLAHHAPSSMVLLFSKNPYASYARIAQHFFSETPKKPVISDRASIASTARIGSHCSIAPGVVIEDHAVIGDHCVIGSNTVIGHHVEIGAHSIIHANVTLHYCLIGTHAILHSGIRIGQDGFGFATDAGVHLKVPQLGRVLIGNHVEIGANSCIDRGAGPDTIIGDGCKIDNLVQIGHNVQLGKGCIIVSQVGISGSTKCGDYVVLGGQSGIAGHLSLGSMASVAAQSGVMHNLEPKEIVGGSPAVPIKQWHRQTVALQKLIGKTKEKKND